MKEGSTEVTDTRVSRTWRSWFTVPSVANWQWKPTSVELLESVEGKILKHNGLVFEQQQVVAGNHTINTVKIGSGPPLVLLHGFGAGLGFWVSNLAELSKHHTIYAIDLPGFGRSSRLPFKGKTTVEAEEYFLSAIEAWRQKVELKEQFALLGHSFGGYIASAYALKHPQNINHLILADPWGIPTKPEDNPLQKAPLRWRILRSVLTMFNPLSAVRVAGPYGPYLITRFRRDIEEKFKHVYDDTSIVSQYIYHLNAQSPSGEMAFGILNSSLGWAKDPMIDRLPDLHNSVPVTLMYGSHSWMDKEAGMQLQQLLGSRAKFHIVPQSGHHIYVDNHAFFNKCIIDASKAATNYRTKQGINVNIVL